MRALLCAIVFAASACGGGEQPNPRDAADANDLGRTVAPRTPSEQTILQQLGELPVDGTRTFGGDAVVAGAAYHSASGRSCRQLRITSEKKETSQRLACTDGKAWFFVPDVLGLEAAQ